MFNFRLQVFHSAAHHLNFTKAAEELYITQPAITKNIKELEKNLGIDLFNRSKGGISLTPAGILLKEYTNRLEEQEKELRFRLSELSHSLTGVLRVGASTTIGQYILPRVMGEYDTINPDLQIILFNDNSEKIEAMTLSKEIDLGVVEGNSRQKELKYTPFMHDEIVAIACNGQPISTTDKLTIEELKQVPLVLREPGSGSLEVITRELHKHNLRLKDMHIRMHLGSTESIKTFLRTNNCIGFVSIHAIREEPERELFKIIPIESLSIQRTLHFIYPQGQQNGLVENFIEYITGELKSNREKSHPNQAKAL